MPWSLCVYLNLPDSYRSAVELLISHAGPEGSPGCLHLSLISGTDSGRSEVSLGDTSGTRKEIADRLDVANLSDVVAAAIGGLIRTHQHSPGQAQIAGTQLYVYLLGDPAASVGSSTFHRVALAIRRGENGLKATFGVGAVNLVAVPAIFGLTGLGVEVEPKRNVYAFLREMQVLQRPQDQTRPLYDSVLWLSDSNIADQNVEGFQGLDESGVVAMISETIAALMLEHRLTNLFTAAQAGNLERHGSAGCVSIAFKLGEIIRSFVRSHGAELLTRLFVAPESEDADMKREDDGFWQDASLERHDVERRVLTGLAGDQNLMRLLWFPASLWEFKRQAWFSHLTLELIGFLQKTPARIASYGAFVLDQRLRKLTDIIARHGEKLQLDANQRVRDFTDRLLRGFTPGEVLAEIDALKNRIASQVRLLGEQGVEEKNPFGFPPGGDSEAMGNSSAPDLEACYGELCQSIENRPLPLAVYSRYVYVGVLVGLALDLVVTRLPDFVLNIGPLKSPGVPLILTLCFFSGLGVWKHARADRRYRLARRAYISVVERIATNRARAALQAQITSFYEGVTLALKCEHDTFAKLQEHCEHTRRRLTEGLAEEPVTRFHLSLLARGVAEGESLLSSRVRLEYKVGQTNEVDWKVESREFVSLLDEEHRCPLHAWRKLPYDEKASGHFESVLLSFSERGYAHFRELSLVGLLSTNPESKNQAVWTRLSRDAYPAFPVSWAGADDGPRLHQRCITGELPALQAVTGLPATATGANGIVAVSRDYLRLVRWIDFDLASVPLFWECRRTWRECLEAEREASEPEWTRGLRIPDPLTGEQEGPLAQDDGLAV